jgi:PAS domain S-box-containing protein
MEGGEGKVPVSDPADQPDDHDRLADLCRRVQEWARQGALRSPDHPAAEGQDLSAALEELRAAQEDLLAQNDKLSRTSAQLAEERRRYRELFELAPDAYLVTDARGVITEANHVAGQLLRLDWRLLKNEPLATFIEARDRRFFREELQRLAQGSGVRRFRWRVRPRRRRESSFDAEWSAAVLHDRAGHVSSIRWLLRDVSSLTAVAAQQLEELQARLGSLAAELSLAAERERRRIAVEIHDRISQSLAIAKMRIASMRQHASEPNGPVMDEVVRLLEQTLEDTRSLTFELSPPILYELGLIAALQWLGEQVEKRHGLRVVVDGNCPPGALPQDLRVMLFQAVRELLMNVVKHARATTARVSCRVIDRAARVTVADDGVGFDPSRLSAYGPGQAGFGLFSIRTRIEQLNGRFVISSIPGEGTRVTLSATTIDTSATMHGDAHDHEDPAGGRPPDRPRGTAKPVEPT